MNPIDSRQEHSTAELPQPETTTPQAQNDSPNDSPRNLRVRTGIKAGVSSFRAWVDQQ